MLEWGVCDRIDGMRGACTIVISLTNEWRGFQESTSIQGAQEEV